MSLESIVNKEPEATKPKVYIIDDNSDFRTSLVLYLSTRGMAGIAFASGRAFLGEVLSLAPSPIILDLRMPGMPGLELLAELVRLGIDWPVIVLTGHGAVDHAVRALKLGAMDFLEKPVDGECTVALLNKAFVLLEENQQNLSARALARSRLSSLTARQMTVIDGLIRGLSNKQVALNLSLSSRTVEMHRGMALSKLGVKTIAETLSLVNSANWHPGRSDPLHELNDL